MELDADANGGGGEAEDIVGIPWKVMGLLGKEMDGGFGVLGLRIELGILVVNNRNDDEIEEDDDIS